RLCMRHQCLLAQSFAGAGFVPIIDYVIVDRARLNGYRAQLPGLRLRLVTLAPGAEVALARDRLRPEKTVAAAWTHLDAVIRQGLGEAGLWVDNGGMTADETVAHILAAQERALVE
ncbi:MAG TPA: hypothetical protein VK689_13475, partial [Armatimonadota bacterium]|nr:hypothetical protein [Armatimonadota bacterium]